MTLKQQQMLGTKLEILRGLIWHNDQWGEPGRIGVLRRTTEWTWETAMKHLERDELVRKERVPGMCCYGWWITVRGREWYREQKLIYESFMREGKL